MRRTITLVAAAALILAMSALPAAAADDHYVATPNGKCHQVAAGQTSIDDASHGGYHQLHDHVHTGAASPDNKTLGHGRATVEVYKATQAPESCV